MLLSGFDALFSEGSCAPAQPPSLTSPPTTFTPSLSGSWRKKEKKIQKKQEQNRAEDSELEANSLVHSPILQRDWWQMACFKINLSINRADCSLPWAFTAVCRSSKVHSIEELPAEPGLQRTGVSSLFTAIIWMLQTPISCLWQRLYRSFLLLEYLLSLHDSIWEHRGLLGAVDHSSQHRYLSNWRPLSLEDVWHINWTQRGLTKYWQHLTAPSS